MCDPSFIEFIMLVTGFLWWMQWPFKFFEFLFNRAFGGRSNAE
jgi:hypothetical protein